MRKVCSACKKEKSIDDFHKCSSKKDGRQSFCIECSCERKADWRKNNKDRASETSARWYRNNKEKKDEQSSRWRKNNKDKVSKIYARWCEKNKEKKAETRHSWGIDNRDRLARNQARYRASKLRASVDFGNKGCISIFYRERDWISSVLNKKYHVDHVVPLQGENVCGLHVETNLRIIPASHNISKSNKLKEKAYA